MNTSNVSASVASQHGLAGHVVFVELFHADGVVAGD
ncbi:hypothetical protein PM8797T_19285, partial [Gimesia maris DSM 8797]